jgi:hypothetical protein
MKKIYRVTVLNKTTGRRELIWQRYSSQSEAQKMADKMNKQDAEIDAKVLVEVC